MQAFGSLGPSEGAPFAFESGFGGGDSEVDIFLASDVDFLYLDLGARLLGAGDGLTAIMESSTGFRTGSVLPDFAETNYTHAMPLIRQSGSERIRTGALTRTSLLIYKRVSKSLVPFVAMLDECSIRALVYFQRFRFVAEESKKPTEDREKRKESYM